MKTFLSILMLFIIVAQVVSSPVPYSKQSKGEKERVLYDQRQEGEWNIRADLKNFVILIIPKSPEAQEPSPSSSLLDLFTRSHVKHHGKHVKHIKPANNLETNEVGAETMHFIESKTAPYHVDITKSSSHLMNDEILATQTPPALAAKAPEEKTKEKSSEIVNNATATLLRQLRSTRFSKAFVLTVPEEEFVLTKTEENKKVVKKDGNKKKMKVKDEMALIGATEQCGPDMIRDSEGICRLKTVADISGNYELVNSLKT